MDGFAKTYNYIIMKFSLCLQPTKGVTPAIVESQEKMIKRAGECKDFDNSVKNVSVPNSVSSKDNKKYGLRNLESKEVALRASPMYDAVAVSLMADTLIVLDYDGRRHHPSGPNEAILKRTNNQLILDL
jgi:hypothetical protein